MGFFTRCNPYPVLLYFISVTVLSAIYNNPYHTSVLLVSSVVTFIMIRGKLKYAAMFFSVFVLTFIINPLISKRGSNPLFFIGNTPVMAEAVLYGLNSAGLIFAILFLFYCFSRIIDTEKLLYLLSPLSASAALVVSATLRFAPLYARRAKVIADQQKALGAQKEKTIPQKIKFGIRVFSALSTWALEHGIITADSMECRGYGTSKRAFYKFYGFKAEDAVLLLSITALIFVTVIPSFMTNCFTQYYPGYVYPQINTAYLISAAGFTLLSFLPVIFEVTDRIRWKFLMRKI